MPGSLRLRAVVLSRVSSGGAPDDIGAGRDLRLGFFICTVHLRTGGIRSDFYKRAGADELGHPGEELHMTRTRVKPGQAVQVPWWVRGDANAFFGLGLGVLVNVLVLTSLVLAVVHFSKSDVFGVVLPALGVELVLGNVYYAYLARRLSRRENRTDVTAMPYGPSVPHMFIVTFVIMLPIYLRTKDPRQAWAAGLAWAFIIGVIVLIGAFIGPTIRRFTPRAALLGTLAGISIAFISMRPAAQMWEAAWIALPVLAMIIIGFVSGVQLPGNFPMGLAALLLGSALAWAGGFMETAAVTDAAKQIAVGIPNLEIGKLVDGLE